MPPYPLLSHLRRRARAHRGPQRRRRRGKRLEAAERASRDPVFATHAVLSLLHHDPDHASPHAWSGAYLVATTVMRFNALLSGLTKFRRK
jgi:hypothetical protein